jgi:polysaccharide export outer membrane protein
MFGNRKFPATVFIVLATLLAPPVAQAELPGKTVADAYQIQPGDVLSVSVWKEEDLIREVIVRPDGWITFPLVGEAEAAGNSIENLRLLISERLKKYIPDPVVTVSVRQLAGNTVYVIGKVNRPGEFPIIRNIDVMQALSMAGGTSTYAALNDIKILRRQNGKLSAMSFKYAEVEKGKRLEQNIVLRAGDVVVVP